MQEFVMPAQTSNSSSQIAPLSKPTQNHAKSSDETKNMIAIMTSQRMSAAAADPLARNSKVDVSVEQSDDVDSRSSSLSDPDDAMEDRANPSNKDNMAIDDAEGDSEAETDVLTPRKAKSATLPTNGTSNNVDKSPSKLIQQLLPDDSSPPLVESIAEDIPPTSSNLFTHTLSPSPSKDAHPSPNIDQDTNTNSRKRKRTASLTSSLSDTDEPLAKRRSSSHKDMEAPTSPPEAGVLDLQDADMEEKLEHVEEAISPEEGAANGVNEDEAATPVPTIAVKGRRGKKGKRKGGRKPFGQAESELIGDPAEALAEEEDAAEVVEAEAEEEDNSSNGELVAKKRSAMDAFNGIEKEFAAFRERHLNEQLLQINRDLDLLRHDLHPEYLAQQRCIDNHRDTKLKHERALQGYKNESLRIKIVAERTQLHSQFFQEVRELKEKTLEKCYTDLYALQKDRRRWGADESNYNYLYNPKRTLQIQQQASYNLEVSILSGVAKHVGFPAAPDINGLVTADIDSDFAAMQMPTRPTQPRILLRDAERSAGENGFFEQNAWANPPTVANAMLQQAHSQNHSPLNHFSTPQLQKRVPELPATNGSNSTVAMMSAGRAPISDLYGTPQDFGAETSGSRAVFKMAGLDGGSTKGVSSVPLSSGSKLQDGSERIYTTHGSARGTPTAQQDQGLPLPPPPPMVNHSPALQRYATPNSHGGQRDGIYGSGMGSTPMATATATVGGFPP